jgi:hypothetical protein
MDHFTDSPVLVKNNDSNQSESPVVETGLAAEGEAKREAEMIKVAQLLKMKRDGFRFGMQRTKNN